MSQRDLMREPSEEHQVARIQRSCTATLLARCSSSGTRARGRGNHGYTYVPQGGVGVKQHPSLPKNKSWTRTRKEAVTELAGTSVEVERLREMGFTPEDLARVVYEKVQAEELPNFLKHVQIGADGGIDKISELWKQRKVLVFSYLMGSVICNVASLLLLNWTLCQSFLFFVERVWKYHATPAQIPLWSGKQQVHASWLKLDLEQHMPNPHTQARFLTVAVIIAFVEVAIIFCWVLRGAYLLACFARGGCEYEAFASICQLLQDILPRLSTFSSISLMARVHPSLIYSEYQEAVESSPLRKCRAGWLLFTLGFSISRLFCATAAVCGFAVKMVATTFRVVNPKYGSLVPCLYVGALINQCMGSVLVEQVLQDRIFLFIFGGNDTSYQDDERALRSAYMCRVAKEIWRHFWKGGQRFKAMVLLATFDHYDLQRLIIEELEDVEVTLSMSSSGCRSQPFQKTFSLSRLYRSGSLDQRFIGHST
eukprot:CAMPEP_0175384400 /NCGR_PEP_ID=MMETSP0095-20121207/28321_1 /TAXON_ID=311494 /ORGANISM="Alexandrium monilatum, Strain CCMP3105" /LENGTH=480 /DNA_ID=CAMNT_0016682813 /DNA_START=32 /DNA_END=1474 /DNA_ORIENTATION=+